MRMRRAGCGAGLAGRSGSVGHDTECNTIAAVSRQLTPPERRRKQLAQQLQRRRRRRRDEQDDRLRRPDHSDERHRDDERGEPGEQRRVRAVAGEVLAQRELSRRER